MSILCAHVPDFAYLVCARSHKDWVDQPVVLLGPDERVWAMSPLARESRVAMGLPLSQALARCPDASVHELSLSEVEATQVAFTSAIAETGLPVEVSGQGAAYCDLSTVATSPMDAQPICIEIGKQLRQTLGTSLTPAIGCDTGKFTARAAADVARPGRMRIVDGPDEARFLAPLPITLLPLSVPVILELGYLGLTTMADFARLPVTAVAQRWGKAGKLAHQLARGRDDRPVLATQAAQPEPISVDFEWPCESKDLSVATILRSLQGTLADLADDLRGCQQLRVEMTYMDNSQRTEVIQFAQALSEPEEIRAALAQALARHAWPAPLTQVKVQLQEVRERQPMQLTLFGDADVDIDTGVGATNLKNAMPFARLTEKLALKYAHAFFRADLNDPTHPIAERRFDWLALA